jgi:hypothetical protein
MGLPNILSSDCCVVDTNPKAVSFIYGIDNNNIIWQINPYDKIYQPVLNTGLTGISNGMSFDIVRQHLFLFNSSNTGDLYFWNLNNTFELIGNISILGNLNFPVIPSGAAFYANAIWLFFPYTQNYSGPYNSTQLVKISFNYDSIIPTIASIEIITTNINLPPLDNRFGDISIDNIGNLYANTNSGKFYSLNVNNPNSSFALINNDVVFLQNSFDSTLSILYGHSFDSGNWYRISLDTGNLSLADFVTSITPESISGVGFRDLCGANTISLPSIN